MWSPSLLVCPWAGDCLWVGTLCFGLTSVSAGWRCARRVAPRINCGQDRSAFALQPSWVLHNVSTYEEKWKLHILVHLSTISSLLYNKKFYILLYLKKNCLIKLKYNWIKTHLNVQLSQVLTRIGLGYRYVSTVCISVSIYPRHGSLFK